MPSSLPHSPDGIGIAVVDVQPSGDGWRLGIAIPGDLHGPRGILQGGLSSALPRIAAAALLDNPTLVDGHSMLPHKTSADITTVHAKLRRPTPVNALLHAEVHVEDRTDIHVTVHNGDEVTIRSIVDVSGPPPIPLIGDLGDLSTMAYPPLAPQDSYPHCFICGADNVRGLHLQPQPLGTTGLAAAPWTPDQRVDDGTGHVHPAAVSAVLDCPGVWAGLHRIEFDPARSVALLADYRIQWFDHPPLGTPCRTVARVDDIDERTLSVRTALFDDQHRMRAMATAMHVFAPTMPAPPVASIPLG